MECQNITKNLKINKDKRVGRVIIVVEGEMDEFRLLKHIFTKVLDYNYISLKRNKIIQHQFNNKDNTIIIANTKSSSIKSIIDETEYVDKLHKLLNEEFNESLKNIPIYIIWDRDKDINNKEKEKIKKYYETALKKFANAWDNDEEMNGLLLLSYPCHESYNLANFNKRLWKKTFSSSKECKKEFSTSINLIKDINEKTLLLAVENMHRSMKEFGLISYDTANFKNVNETIFKKEEENFMIDKNFLALSLISILLIDLGIITEKEF